MRLAYVPLLKTQRDLLDTPIGLERFRQYLRTMLNGDGSDVELAPLVAINPMAKGHVAALLDTLLALDADRVGARAAEEAAAELDDDRGEYKATLIVVDDLKGGWTNRFAVEFGFRFGYGPFGTRPQDVRRFWVTGVLWSSEAATEPIVRETMRAVVYRTAYMKRHGPARTLREMLAQEGWVMAMAGSTGPVLDEDDLAYTREVIAPYLDATDMRTAVECLFGDAAARSLGFTPRGLTHRAGLALALHEASATGAKPS